MRRLLGASTCLGKNSWIEYLISVACTQVSNVSKWLMLQCIAMQSCCTYASIHCSMHHRHPLDGTRRDKGCRNGRLHVSLTHETHVYQETCRHCVVDVLHILQRCEEANKMYLLKVSFCILLKHAVQYVNNLIKLPVTEYSAEDNRGKTSS